MSAQLTQSCRVIGLLSDLTPETIRHHEWKSNGMPRKNVVRYTVGNLTYLVAGHPATHAEALKPSLVGNRRRARTLSGMWYVRSFIEAV